MNENLTLIEKVVIICLLGILVAMVGAIFLTLRKREGVKKQSVYKQILRK